MIRQVPISFAVFAITFTSFILHFDKLRGSELLEVKPPVERGRTLNRQELRYCRSEIIRLGMARDVMESKSAELGSRHFRAFNAAVDDYNLRCSDHQYYEDDNNAVDSDVSLRLPQLVIEGSDLERLVRWHQNSLWHVTADVLNLRKAPTVNSTVIQRLEKHRDVIRIGSPRDGWLPVRLGEVTGYVDISYVSRGSGSESRRLECLATAGDPLRSGEILYGKRNGQNEILVKNGLKRDAIFKLKRRDRGTEVSFFVKSGDNARIRGVADGVYRLIFATGLEYNQSWNRFCSQGSSPRAFQNHESFESTQSQYTSVELTLHPVPSGNSAIEDVEEQEAFHFWED